MKDLSGNMPGAGEIARRIAAGELTAAEAVRACLARIEETDGGIEAWAFLDPALPLAEAEARDRALAAGEAPGPLQGVPVGIKDIIDTADMPTECGTPLLAGRRPEADAEAVRRLRAAGAVIMGKTVTAELATVHPGKTRNPHDPSRTPGGSSSGSAAAVAAGMVPLAVGTQTAGSVIRPAAFCGVYGLKPTLGAIPTAGVLNESAHLDTLGAYGRSLDDIELGESVLAGGVPGSAPADAPRIGFCRTPFWEQVDAPTAHALETLAARLAPACRDMSLPDIFADALDVQRAIMTADIARNFAEFNARGRDQLSERLQDLIDEGAAVTPDAYAAAVADAGRLIDEIPNVFNDFDVLLTPAAIGEAPGPETTGNPMFCSTWTLLGTPALSLPLLQGASGLPVGVQLVAARDNEAGLLAAARWIERELADGG